MWRASQHHVRRGIRVGVVDALDMFPGLKTVYPGCYMLREPFCGLAQYHSTALL